MVTIVLQMKGFYKKFGPWFLAKKLLRFMNRILRFTSMPVLLARQNSLAVEFPPGL